MLSAVEPGSRRSPGGDALADGGSAVGSGCGYFIPNNMGYHTYLNPMPEGLLLLMPILICAKGPSQLGLLVFGVNMGCDTSI